MVRGNWIKPGAVIIDVGINPVEVSISSVFLGMHCFCRPYAFSHSFWYLIPKFHEVKNFLDWNSIPPCVFNRF